MPLSQCASRPQSTCENDPVTTGTGDSKDPPPPQPYGWVVPFFRTYGAVAYAVAVGAFYVAGFLALNAFLATRGIYDFEFINPRIVLAGAGFCLFLICFYLFAGRAVLFTPKWLGEDLKQMNAGRARPFWSVLVFIYSFVHATFFVCFSAAIFVSIAVGHTYAYLFYSVIAIAFLVLYTLDILNLDIRHPRSTLVVRFVFEVAAIIVFFLQPNNGLLITAFFTYAAMFAFVNLVLDKFDRYIASADTIGFSVLYALLFTVIVVSTAYGALFYGSTSNKLGGARPLPVEFVLSADAKTAIGDSDIGRRLVAGRGDLLYQTDVFLYLLIDDRTIRVKSSDVVAMQVRIEDAPHRSLQQVLDDLFHRQTQKK
jgi:hypothetical protein